MKWFAPAKINFWLNIVGKRQDGYHFLESLFAAVNLFDEMIFQKSNGTIDEVQFSDTDGKSFKVPNNTVERAISLFRNSVPITPSVNISVTKNIPMGAGLGGGSSNAALTLTYLQKNYGNEASGQKLQEMAEKIGGDVSFFLNARPALVSGIGEKIRPYSLGKIPLVVIYPGFGVNTGEAYGWHDQNPSLTRHDATVSRHPSSGVLDLTARTVVEFMHNDLEKTVEARHPEIATLKAALRRWGALGSLMSGSGSSVFGVYATTTDALKAKQELENELPSRYKIFSCSTLD